ncbi:MAG: XdhC family protein [Lachnospiraceae bacterium]|jgi:xanthine dehydrogenase accessory factor|nr:XdhC family protein [Lachnospiraceae bacterium]
MKGYDEILGQLRGGALYLFTVISGPNIGEKMTLQGDAVWCQDESLRPFWEEAAGFICKDPDAPGSRGAAKSAAAVEGEQGADEPEGVHGVAGADAPGGTEAWPKLSSLPCKFHVAGHPGWEIYAERLVSEPELVICGGGHVSMELAAMADYLEYPYVVMDDREEFANTARFPGAKQVMCGEFADTLGKTTFSADAYYVIVTRGHLNDLACLELVMNRPFGYVGMIGSKLKVKRAMEYMTEKGFSPEQLRNVHAPIGLSIGAQTPKEIAVSIFGEIIQRKHLEAPSACIDQSMFAAMEKHPGATLCRIIDKRGSAPRGTGSWMLVGKDGYIAGTVGGGKIEYLSVELAKGLAMNGGSVIQSYRLNNDTAAALGMWCGGEVDILFENS